ncbi:hypothetical protein PsorP6_015288 [Peronosclerospora sorghi]|uniref:Uncharacterized protein n=1 Tax=Peronosclerospora sorghi TaxID=230839 RepID=A0ACC0VS89_9STRA|nr:hypothetical protein PsorP6_015288 [Peronosclerospora sorghi]
MVEHEKILKDPILNATKGRPKGELNKATKATTRDPSGFEYVENQFIKGARKCGNCGKPGHKRTSTNVLSTLVDRGSCMGCSSALRMSSGSHPTKLQPEISGNPFRLSAIRHMSPKSTGSVLVFFSSSPSMF